MFSLPYDVIRAALARNPGRIASLTIEPLRSPFLHWLIRYYDRVENLVGWTETDDYVALYFPANSFPTTRLAR